MPPAVLDAFHPTLARWFRERLGEPTAPQVRAWPLIREGRNVLVAAPTGSGKTMAAFFASIDALMRLGQGGEEIEDATRVLYISPLKALGNDIQKNLHGLH